MIASPICQSEQESHIAIREDVCASSLTPSCDIFVLSSCISCASRMSLGVMKG